MLKIAVETADVTEFMCDVLVLKYSQAFHGADAMVAKQLMQSERRAIEISPKPNEHTLLATGGAISADNVLFLGVVPLLAFDYSEIRTFSARALSVVHKELPDASHIAMTIHGVGYGLDEREAFLAQLGGIVDAEKSGGSVTRITIVEKNPRRASRLKAILNETWPQARPGTTDFPAKSDNRPNSIAAGKESSKKPHVFVAMPFAKEMEDIYVLGIQDPINAAGFLCERIDMATFTGDIVERIKTRIETAALVVADLTGGNANVYLEVGYAWGRNRPTLLLAKKGEDLKYDVRGQRRIDYGSIVELKKNLTEFLSSLDVD